MNEVTQLLNAIEAGNSKAASDLLPLVYQELRQLAARQLAEERPGQTLQPTALVHEAYLRLLGPGALSCLDGVACSRSREHVDMWHGHDECGHATSSGFRVRCPEFHPQSAVADATSASALA